MTIDQFLSDEAQEHHAQGREWLIPQVEEINTMYELLLFVDGGPSRIVVGIPSRISDIEDYFGTDRQESKAYLETAELLGLIAKNMFNQYEVAELGILVLTGSLGDVSRSLAVTFVNSWICLELLRIANAKGQFTESDIDDVLAMAKKRNKSRRYLRRELARGRQTIVTWLNEWLEPYVGCVSTVSKGVYKFI